MTITPASILAQTVPLSDAVEDMVSDTYVMQLNCSGAVPPITWTTTQSSPGFLVSPNGVVGTPGLLADGFYQASGTMVDSNGTTGTWQFGLTVYGNPAPQTAVTPTAPLPYSGIEIMVPFQINPATGMVATVTDFRAVLEQHVVSILMTTPGERVMLPSYGAGMEQSAFMPITELSAVELQDRIETALASSETSITLVGVEINSSPSQPYVLNVHVTFTAIPYTGVQSVTVTVGGGLPAIPTNPIGPFL